MNVDPLAPDPNFKIQDELIQEKLHELNALISPNLPEGYGFTLLLHSLGTDSKLFYITTIRKEDMLETLKWFLESQREEPKALPPGL